MALLQRHFELPDDDFGASAHGARRVDLAFRQLDSRRIAVSPKALGNVQPCGDNGLSGARHDSPLLQSLRPYAGSGRKTEKDGAQDDC